MKILNISEAKAQLSSVIEQVVTRGEEFLIGRAGKPVARIVRYEAARKNRRVGLYKGKIHVTSDFDEWPEDVARALGMRDS